MIEVKCPCGKTFQLKDELAGKTIRCRQCNAAIDVPAAGEKFEVVEENLRASGQSDIDGNAKPESSTPPKAAETAATMETQPPKESAQAATPKSAKKMVLGCVVMMMVAYGIFDEITRSRTPKTLPQATDQPQPGALANPAAPESAGMGISVDQAMKTLSTEFPALDRRENTLPKGYNVPKGTKLGFTWEAQLAGGQQWKIAQIILIGKSTDSLDSAMLFVEYPRDGSTPPFAVRNMAMLLRFCKNCFGEDYRLPDDVISKLKEASEKSIAYDIGEKRLELCYSELAVSVGASENAIVSATVQKKR
ncbi:MAG TPA: hypothetical protein VGP72_31955 [Planctomycetota bacterium]|jgi:hypothetical protein